VRAGSTGRLSLRGEDIRLEPRQALALGMAVHELATNAAKYGALSNEAGRIEVTWTRRQKPDGEEQWLHLSWTEHEGPPVRHPERRGFGSRLVDRSIRAELGGRVVADFDRSGLRVVMELPLAPATAEPTEFDDASSRRA
jgi:two-component sensor histidine kinase